MVNMARVFGLGKAQKPSLDSKDEEPGDKSNLKEHLIDTKRGKREKRRRRKEDLKRMIWWDIVTYELQVPLIVALPAQSNSPLIDLYQTCSDIRRFCRVCPALSSFRAVLVLPCLLMRQIATRKKTRKIEGVKGQMMSWRYIMVPAAGICHFLSHAKPDG